jgi:hypothetical protein
MQKDIRLPVYTISEALKVLGVSKHIFNRKFRYHLTRLEKRNGSEIFLKEEIDTINKSIVRYEIID